MNKGIARTIRCEVLSSSKILGGNFLLAGPEHIEIMDILSPQKISELIDELFDISRSCGQKVDLDLVVWVSVWLYLLWIVHEDKELQAIAEYPF